jgi:hypothetical protein
MHIEVECTYCGHKWRDNVLTQSEMVSLRCVNGRCFDSNLKVRDLSKTKVDYYQGSPPFPIKMVPGSD